MTAVVVSLSVLGGLVCGAASVEAQERHHPVAGALIFALGVLVAWCGVVQL